MQRTAGANGEESEGRAKGGQARWRGREGSDEQRGGSSAGRARVLYGSDGAWRRASAGCGPWPAWTLEAAFETLAAQRNHGRPGRFLGGLTGPTRSCTALHCTRHSPLQSTHHSLHTIRPPEAAHGRAVPGPPAARDDSALSLLEPLVQSTPHNELHQFDSVYAGLFGQSFVAAERDQRRLCARQANLRR